MTSDDSPARLGEARVMSTRIREILFAHLVLSIADLRLRKSGAATCPPPGPDRVTGPSRPTRSPSPPPPPKKKKKKIKTNKGSRSTTPFAGRKAGGSASAKARELRAAHPVKTLAEQRSRRTDARLAKRRGRRAVHRLALRPAPRGMARVQRRPDRPTRREHRSRRDRARRNLHRQYEEPFGQSVARTPDPARERRKTDYSQGRPRGGAPSDLVTTALGEPSRSGRSSRSWPRLAIKGQPTDVFVGSPRSVKRWFLEQATTYCRRGERGRHRLRQALDLDELTGWRVRQVLEETSCFTGINVPRG